MKEMKIDLETIKKIYSMLEDKESKDIYMYRLALSITDIFNYATYATKLGSTYVACLNDRSPQKLLGKLVASLPADRNFVLYGAGQDGADILPYLAPDKRFMGFCSGTQEKQKRGYLGYPVLSPERLLSQKDLCVIISTVKYKNEIMQILKDGGYPQELIIDGPAFYRPEFNAEAEQYFGPSFIKFQQEEVFVDAGCFDFNTSLAMSKHCDRVKVYAFEPDTENYRRCLENIKSRDKDRMVDVRLFPYGTWSEKTTLSFNMKGTGSCICVSDDSWERIADSSVAVMPIDEAIESGDRVTMIKMDVEGAELESLKGAKQTIMRDKPKLAICIYHKPEDLWEIPLYIKDLVPEYRLYIRHHSIEPYETVLYAVMPE